MRPTIEVYDEAALDAIKRDHERLRNLITELQREVAAISGGGHVQPVIGESTGVAGTATGSVRVTAKHGVIGREADGYTVDAEVRHFTTKTKQPLLMLQNPWGAWYAWLPCPRLVKTMSDGTYPSDPANTFEFVYTKLSFTLAQGTQTQTFTDESEEAQGLGQTADGAYVPEDTLCLAVPQANACHLLLPLECG